MATSQLSATDTNPVLLDYSARWGVTPRQAYEIIMASTPKKALKLHWLYTEGKK